MKIKKIDVKGTQVFLKCTAGEGYVSATAYYFLFNKIQNCQMHEIFRTNAKLT